MIIPQSEPSDRFQPYGALSTVPELLLRQRSLELPRTKAYSRLVLAELLIRVLLALLWRSRTIREATLGNDGANNVFKSALSLPANVATPEWVAEELRCNPEAQFWQYCFADGARGVMPRDLAPLFDEYVEHCRPLLVCKEDPGTLFLGKRGGRLSAAELNNLVSGLAARHAGCGVTIPSVRDSFARVWLAAHPGDYLNLSEILWHRNIELTERFYGC
jgi:hypothetical protein